MQEPFPTSHARQRNSSILRFADAVASQRFATRLGTRRAWILNEFEFEFDHVFGNGDV